MNSVSMLFLIGTIAMCVVSAQCWSCSLLHPYLYAAIFLSVILQVWLLVFFIVFPGVLVYLFRDKEAEEDCV